jgi:hypothetical protein
MFIYFVVFQRRGLRNKSQRRRSSLMCRLPPHQIRRLIVDDNTITRKSISS